MKVVAIATMPFDLEVACFGTLSRFINQGHEVFLIIAKISTEWNETEMNELKKHANMIGVSKVYSTDEFDYSSVTQYNVDIINLIIKDIVPGIVFIPFWKSSNIKRQIVSKTSLIACRGIGSILMYELEDNKLFQPSVYFTIYPKDILLKMKCLANHYNKSYFHLKLLENNFILDLTNMHRSHWSLLKIIKDHSDTLNNQDKLIDEEVRSNKNIIEVFESHRIILNDQNNTDNMIF